jgi:hypothetical protein
MDGFLPLGWVLLLDQLWVEGLERDVPLLDATEGLLIRELDGDGVPLGVGPVAP